MHQGSDVHKVLLMMGIVVPREILRECACRQVWRFGSHGVL